MILSGKAYLITTDEPFFTEEGFAYRSVYGTAWVHSFQESFNFPAKNHANWFVRVTEGEDNDKGLLIAGCRINYAKQMDNPPKLLLTNSVMMLGSDNIPFPFYYPNIYIIKS